MYNQFQRDNSDAKLSVFLIVVVPKSSATRKFGLANFEISWLGVPKPFGSHYRHAIDKRDVNHACAVRAVSIFIRCLSMANIIKGTFVPVSSTKPHPTAVIPK